MDGAPRQSGPRNQPPGSPCAPTGSAGGACRLNLLLSYAGWQPDSWADRLPVLLEPLGIRTLRVCSARHASDIIRFTPVHIAVVDLGLPLEDSGTGGAGAPPAGQPGRLPPIAPPEEAGPRLLDLLSRLSAPPPTLVIKRSRTHRDDSREIAAALRAGAFAVLDRPESSRDVETLLDSLRRCLIRYYQGRWPALS